jgi:membrane-associated phospholipid phosphatase
MLAGKHFLSDVLAGALLGVAGGAAVHAIKF